VISFEISVENCKETSLIISVIPPFIKDINFLLALFFEKQKTGCLRTPF